MARNFAIGGLLLVMMATAVPALADCQGAPKWLWSATSDVVNRSTQALAAGRTDQAERLAEAALGSRVSPVDARIADHNLCLTGLAGGGAADTNAHCQSALAGAERVTLLCGASLSRARKATGPDLAAAIAGNIAAADHRGTMSQATAAADR